MKTKITYKILPTSQFYDQNKSHEENEGSFKLPVQLLNKLTNKFTKSEVLEVLKIEYITQAWIAEDLDNCMRTRLRQTIERDQEKLSLDVKFYNVKVLNNDVERSTRYEFNNALTREEWATLAALYRKTIWVSKTRITLKDLTTNLIYTADIYPDKSDATIEIEFDNQIDLFKWKKPNWAYYKKS